MLCCSIKLYSNAACDGDALKCKMGTRIFWMHTRADVGVADSGAKNLGATDRGVTEFGVADFGLADFRLADFGGGFLGWRILVADFSAG